MKKRDAYHPDYLKIYPWSEGPSGYFEILETVRPKAGVSRIRFKSESHTQEQADDGNRGHAAERGLL